MLKTQGLTSCQLKVGKNLEKQLLMRVFPEVIVLTTKPRIDAYVLFT